MPNICPVCFSDIGTPSYADFQWTDDPIFTTPTLSTAQYVGFTRMKAQHIKELQQNRNQLEINLGLTPTIFTPIDVTNLFQNWDLYIRELRQSTETLLSAVGMTKETYFNYDKDGNDMHPGNHQLDWIDVVDLTNHALCKFQMKGRHIEDLRHYIQQIWIEQFNITPEQTYFTDILTIVNDPYYFFLNAYDVTGDKGTHQIRDSVNISSNPVEYTSHIDNLGQTIDDGSGTSKKLYIKANIDGLITSGTDYGISLINQPDFFVRVLSPAGYLVHTNTRLYWDAIYNGNITGGVPGQKQVFVACQVVFNGGYTPIVYYYSVVGGPPGLAGTKILLSLSEFNNMNRKISDDYGSPLPSGIRITELRFYIYSFCNIYAVTYPSMAIETSLFLDNIKLAG